LWPAIKVGLMYATEASVREWRRLELRHFF
jgi:hypothetical protein